MKVQMKRVEYVNFSPYLFFSARYFSMNAKFILNIKINFFSKVCRKNFSQFFTRESQNKSICNFYTFYKIYLSEKLDN